VPGHTAAVAVSATPTYQPSRRDRLRHRS
jgi:hypothetical protein